MAWNPSPQVAAARDFGEKFRADRVIIYYVREDGTYGYASWGKRKALCDEAGKVADDVFEEIGHKFAMRHG